MIQAQVNPTKCPYCGSSDLDGPRSLEGEFRCLGCGEDVWPGAFVITHEKPRQRVRDASGKVVSLR